MRPAPLLSLSLPSSIGAHVSEAPGAPLFGQRRAARAPVAAGLRSVGTPPAGRDQAPIPLLPPFSF
jgi:hypothetical protein